MTQAAKNAGLRNLPEEIHRRKRIILGELKDRTLWFVRLRWWVPPSIAAGTGVAWLIGVQFAAPALFLVALFILASILLPPPPAYGFAGLVAAGMGLIAAAEYLGWIPHHALGFRGQAINLANQPFHVTVELSFF